MFIMRGRKSRKVLSIKISLLTTSGEYIEYSMIFRQKMLTQFVIDRLKSLFSEYLLVYDSEILISDGIIPKDPIYVYLTMIYQHVNFLLNTKSIDDILRRICKYHHNITKNPLMKVNKFYLNKVWKFLLRRNRCPWITQHLDYQIQKIGPRYKQKEIMLMRIGIYYMFIKKKYRDINNRAKEKKIAMQKIANEQYNSENQTVQYILK